MKTHHGLISNSSAMSFCIVGWTLDCNEFDDKAKDLKKRLTDACQLNIRLISDSKGNAIVGIGNYEYEFDHNYVYEEGDWDWQDHDASPPPYKDVDALREIAKKLNLEPPQEYAETFWG